MIIPAIEVLEIATGQFQDFISFDNILLFQTIIFVRITVYMRKIGLLLLFACFSTFAGAHEYFFAFAEVSYNDKDEVLEATIISSAHETEDALNLSGIEIKELEDHYNDTEMKAKLEKFVLSGFSMTQDSKLINFKLIGFEVDKRGMVNFYFKSEKASAPTPYSVTFDLLMDQFPDQQNKIVFTRDKKTTTAVFYVNKRTEIIKL